MNKRHIYATQADKAVYEAVPFQERLKAHNAYDLLVKTAQAFPDAPAVSFQMFGKPTAKSVTFTWAEILAWVHKAANTLRALGVTPEAPVGLIMPNCPEMAVCLLAGQVAGGVVPINPLLQPENVAALLREMGVKTVVSLSPFPKTDLAEKTREACRLAQVETLLEVDLKGYIGGPLGLIIPLIRPRTIKPESLNILDFATVIQEYNDQSLDFAYEAELDTVAAYFHTGGTTGAPKIAPHTFRGMLFNAMVSNDFLITDKDTILCPLPLFHVLAAYPMWFACLASGGHLVLPTPMGYRGEGVIDNFWQLCEKWKITLLCTVPTAISALLQKPVNADVSTVKYALCGSAPMPVDTFNRFQENTKIKILEGYGQTETTCLISCNPPDGEPKIGSVGLVFPYTDVKIAHVNTDLTLQNCATGEVGEILVRGPQVIAGYRESERNVDLFAEGYLRTGDRGRLDEDSYLWITGRAKDLIIRGGHNIDPGMIEEALAKHPDVIMACAIGQPDAHAGELPCAYVEVREGATVTQDELMTHASMHIAERPARPCYIEVVAELPKTTVGKIYKPAMRKKAIERVFKAVLEAEGITVSLEVVDGDKTDFMVNVQSDQPDQVDKISQTLNRFTQPWMLQNHQVN